MNSKILQKIQKEFHKEKWQEIIDLLNKYGSRPYHKEIERVQYDILLLSEEDISLVSHYVETALTDYRDILYWAEYYDNAPWVMWNKIIKEFREKKIITKADSERLKNIAHTGFKRVESLTALEKLCTLLLKKGKKLAKEEYEQIRQYGKRWKSRAIWLPLRKLIPKK
ncbi:hypothetical protein ACFL35_15955 [Candidatus Riflebacteria bacterium]